MPWKIHKKRHLTSFQVIILGFAGVILFGALILMLPISSAQANHNTISQKHYLRQLLQYV